MASKFHIRELPVKVPEPQKLVVKQLSPKDMKELAIFIFSPN
jgi:hypothetical protein